MILFSFFCHKQPVFKVWLIHHWCQKTAQAREGTAPIAPQTFVPRWLPHCKPFSPWLRSWRRSPLPTAIPIAAKRIGLGFVRFRQCGGGGPKAQEDHHTGTGVSVLGKPCIPPTRQPADLELDSEPWSNVDSTLPQMQRVWPRP